MLAGATAPRGKLLLGMDNNASRTGINAAGVVLLQGLRKLAVWLFETVT